MAYLTGDQLKKFGFKKIGSDVRISDKASVYNADQMEISSHVRIDDFCVLSGKISIGNYVHIAPFCLVAGGEKGVFFADFTGLSYGVQVFSQSDDYTGKTLTSPVVPDEYKCERKAAVYLEKHSGLGANSVVFPGVTLAEGCSVGAMSLVNKSTKPWGVYFGIPAKRMKDRKKDMLELEKKFMASLEGGSKS